MISVIISTKNEEKNIARCLESVKNQTYGAENIEIIVVDNNSTDRTKEIVNEMKEGYAPLNTQVFNRGPERSAQKNFGVGRSSGKYFIHLDADMILSENLLTEAHDIFSKNSNIVALYVPEIVTGEKFFSKVRRYERGFYDGTVIDGVRFVRKDIFQKIGGFDEKLYACEDWDLDKRLKKFGRFATTKSVLFHNESEFDLRKYLAKKSYYAENFDTYIEKWGRNDPDIKKQFGFRYRFFGVFTENGKWKKLLHHPSLTLGMFFLRVMVGVKYLTR